jgi:UDP-N-acetylglucosamine 2-epimerase (non-hydrolysing)
MSLPEVHLIGGTRLEAIKLAPVAIAMRGAGLLQPVLIAGGRHPAVVRQSLAAFDLAPDVALEITRGDSTEAEALTETIRRLDELWGARAPVAVIVQGDTTTSLAGALAAFWRRIPVVHLEAGPRSDDFGSPFPDEANRRLIAQVATLHLAPTPLTAMNLLDENIAAGDVLIAGNTAVDATLAVAGRRLPYENPEVAAARGGSSNRLILVTAYRGAPLDRILAAVRELVSQYPDIDVILTSHREPAVRARIERVTVTGPLPFPDMSRLLSEAYLVLTDSGGIQQVAPSFGVPALHVDCGQLVGKDTGLIVKEASALLDSRVRRDAMTAGGNPYGDGLSGHRSAQAVAAMLGLAPAPTPMPALDSAAITYGANV